MEINPYQVTSLATGEGDFNRLPRDIALRQFQQTFALLLVAALVNYVAFDWLIIGQMNIAYSLKMIYRGVNLFWFGVGGAAIWYGGLPLLEGVSAMLRSVFAPRVDRQAWQGVLYQFVALARWWAIACALVWLMWVGMFYGNEGYSPRLLATLFTWLVAGLISVRLLWALGSGWVRLAWRSGEPLVSR